MEMDIGHRIKQCLKELKLTQDALARRVGVTPTAVSNWVAGKNELSGDSLVSVAAELGVSAMWLQTGRGDKRASMIQAPAPDPLTPPEQALLDMFRGLTEDQKTELLRVATDTQQANEAVIRHYESLKKMGKK